MKFLAALSLLASTVVAADICGQSGYDKGSPASYASDATASTPQLCSALCQKDSQCKSFAVGGGTCNLYTAAVANNINGDRTGLAGPTRSPYYFYDIACAITENSAPLNYDTSKPICTVRGYDRGTPYPYTLTQDQYPETCAKSCAAAGGKCTGFALVDNLFTHRPTGCYLYTSLQNNFTPSNLTNGAETAFYFYEMACFPALSASSASSSTVSTVAATSSSAVPVSNTATTASSTLTTAVSSTLATVVVPSTLATVVSSTRTSAVSSTVTAVPSTICGAKGYDKNSPLAYSAVSGVTLTSCQASCKADSQCKGLVFGDNTCLLYTSTFANNSVSSDLSPYTLYDSTCFAN